MTILEMYEKVNLKTPLEQRVFFNYLNDSVNEMAGLHGERANLVYLPNIASDDIVTIHTFDGVVPLLPLYHNALVDNILFLCGQGDTHKGEFVRKAREAYLHYWSLSSKGKHIKRNRW